jgi:hypothetical protein
MIAITEIVEMKMNAIAEEQTKLPRLHVDKQ